MHQISENKISTELDVDRAGGKHQGMKILKRARRALLRGFIPQVAVRRAVM